MTEEPSTNNQDVVNAIKELQASIDKQITADAEYRKSLADNSSKELENNATNRKSDLELSSKRYDALLSNLHTYEVQQESISKKIDSISLEETNSNLSLINSKLTKLNTTLEKTDEMQLEQEFQHFTNLSIVFFLFVIIPLYATVKILSSILNSASA